MTEIIVADDQMEVLDMLIRSLRDDTRKVQAFSTGREALAYLQQHPNQIGLAILDLDYGPDEPDGLEILPQMLEVVPDLPVIMLTGQGTIDTAVAALRLGATDFIEKDFYIEDKIELSLEKLDRVYQALKENAQLRAEVQDLGRENQYYRDEFGKRYQIIGSSPKLQQILQRAQTVAPIPRPALITGEPGTGKELVAAAIHYNSDRKDRPFVKVNCAAIADQLLESELFGHEKGAYTGATEARPGKFEAASGGTLFLDEIGNTTPEFQQNVLRAIEYSEIQRVGSATPIFIDVRVIAATNTDLETEIAEGRFRQDLYDRLRFEVLHMPPLCERREDIPALADYFVAQIVEEVPGLQKRDFSDAAIERLMTYRWPGNVRELKFATERAACVASGTEIEPDDLPPEVSQKASQSSSELNDGFESQVQSYELSLLRRILDKVSWNQREAAKQLRLSYDQFRHLYRKYKLNKEKP